MKIFCSTHFSSLQLVTGQNDGPRFLGATEKTEKFSALYPSARHTSSPLTAPERGQLDQPHPADSAGAEVLTQTAGRDVLTE
jgi:hypothetical protein